MSAYVVFIRESTLDPLEMDTYFRKVPATFSGHPATILARYGRHEVLEGPGTEGVVLLEFPSMDDAKAWYNSPAYQEALKHRFKGANYRAILFEGV